MAASDTILDMSAYTIGGGDQLAFLEDVVYRPDHDTQDGSPIPREGSSSQIVKRFATIDTGVFSTKSAPTKVTNLDVSLLTIGGTDYNVSLRSGSFSGTMRHDEASGAKDLWKFPEYVGKDYTAKVEVSIATGLQPDVIAAIHNATLSATELIFKITLNTETIEVPMQLKSAPHTFKRDSIQMISMELEGRSPDTGIYPTLPTTTATLLQKAFNAPETSLAVVLDSKASGGARYSGNFLFTGFNFDFNDSQIVTTRYQFHNEGIITHAATV